MPKLAAIGNIVDIVTDLSIFKMAATNILDFKKVQILTIDRVEMFKLRHHNKFGDDR